MGRIVISEDKFGRRGEVMRRTEFEALCSVALVASLSAIPTAAWAQTQPKPATEETKAANAAVLKALPFGNKSDFEDAERGLVARPDKLTIKNDKGDVVWDMEQYKTTATISRPPTP
jgi:alkyl sulfatase BDS1-like metallo-beta-lactamase superfamily hydrolase